MIILKYNLEILKLSRCNYVGLEYAILGVAFNFCTSTSGYFGVELYE